MDDPASPASNPAPVPPSTSGSGPRRIRSMPDRPARSRPAGGIRSLPGDAPASIRLPGTDAASYGSDATWRRGVAILWTLFVCIAACEAFELAVYLLAGGYHWPTLGAILRLTALCGVFLALWSGWAWTRWVLAVVAFLTGARTVLFGFLVDYHGLSTDSTQQAQAFGALAYLGVALALGVLYLLLAASLILSADVAAFIRHRREDGRRWVIVPVGLLVGSYCVAMLGAEYALRHQLENVRPVMTSLARNGMRAMAAHWDPDSIRTFFDAEALEHWSDAGREGFMNTVRPLGTYLGPGDEYSDVFFDAGSIGTDSFIRGACRETARCTEGRATFTFRFVRSLSGPWRMVSLNVGDMQVYEPAVRAAPASTWFATPKATPVPSPGG